MQLVKDAGILRASPPDKQWRPPSATEFQTTSNFNFRDAPRPADDAGDDGDVIRNTVNGKLYQYNVAEPSFTGTVSKVTGAHRQLFWQPPIQYELNSLSAATAMTRRKCIIFRAAD